jgi:hypothetical protein
MNIANARNYGEHGNSAKKSIWHSIMMLAPFEKVKIDNHIFDDDSYINGEKDFYQFIKSLYEDMYHEPDKYAIPTTPYDEYIRKSFNDKIVDKEHINDVKECTLRNTFQQAIQFYPEFIYKIGQAADEVCNKDFALVISKSKYDDVLNSFNKSHISKENDLRMNAILGFGLVINEVNGKYYITGKYYPKLFLGLWVLSNAPDSKYKYMDYLRLDYKGYYRPIPEIDDVKLTMKREHAEIIDLFLKSFKNVKIKYRVKPLRNITSGFNWKIEYTLNGKNIFGFYAEPDYLMLCIYFNNAKNITALSKKLENSDIELFNWFCSKFPERLCKCPNNRAVTFGDTKRRICGLSNRAEIINPSNDDAEKSIQVIGVFHTS